MSQVIHCYNRFLYTCILTSIKHQSTRVIVKKTLVMAVKCCSLFSQCVVYINNEMNVSPVLICVIAVINIFSTACQTCLS